MVDYSKWENVDLDIDSDDDATAPPSSITRMKRPQPPSRALCEGRSLRSHGNNCFEPDPQRAKKLYHDALRAVRSCQEEPAAREEEHRVLLNLAAVAQVLGEPREVVARCTESLQIQPKFSRAFLMRGMARKGLEGEQELARADLAEALDLDPACTEAQQALRELKTAAERQKEGMSDAAHSAALDLFRAGKHAEAQAAWEALVDKLGGDQFKTATVHGHLATCCRAGGDQDGSRTHAAEAWRLVSTLPDALPPQLLGIAASLMESHLEHDSPREALAVLAECQSRIVPWSQGPSATRAKLHRLAGQSHHTTKQGQEAAREFEASLAAAREIRVSERDREEELRSLIGLGASQQQLKRHKEAASTLREAVRISGDIGDTPCVHAAGEQLGRALLRLDEREDALVALGSAFAAAEEAQDAHARVRIAMLAGRVGSMVEAGGRTREGSQRTEQWLYRALEASREVNDDAMEATSLLGLGGLLIGSPDRTAQSQAEICIGKAVDIYTANDQVGLEAEALAMLGKCRGGTQAAVEALRKAHKLFAQVGEARRGADMLYCIGEISVTHLKDLPAATDALEAALAGYHTLGKPCVFEQGSTLRLLGAVASRGKDWRAAKAFLKKAEHVFIEAEQHEQAAATREGMRRLIRQQQQQQEASEEESAGVEREMEVVEVEVVEEDIAGKVGSEAEAVTVLPTQGGTENGPKSKTGQQPTPAAAAVAVHPLIAIQQDRSSETEQPPLANPPIATTAAEGESPQELAAPPGEVASVSVALGESIGAMEAEMRTMREELAELREFRDMELRGGSESDRDARIGVGFAFLVAILAAVAYTILAGKLA